MNHKIECPYEDCKQHLEFPSELLNTTSLCPSCNRKVWLFIHNDTKGIPPVLPPPTFNTTNPTPISRLVYILLAIFLGGWGIHNFVIGRVGVGVTQLICTILGFVLIFPFLITFIWILVDITTVAKDARGNILP